MERNGKVIWNVSDTEYLGDRETFKKVRNQMDSITKFTLELWFKLLRHNKAEKDANVLKWVAFDSSFKSAGHRGGLGQWADKGITAWCTLVNKGKIMSFQDLKTAYGLDWREFYKYLQIRDYYRKRIGQELSLEMNKVVQVMIDTYKGNRVRTITTLYKALMDDKSTTGYIKEKWEREFGMEIPEDEWDKMWEKHKTTTCSRAWREFSWKNLIRFFITPKISNNYSETRKSCWRNCGSSDANHAHIFWNCHKITEFWGMVHRITQEILGYEFPMKHELMYLYMYSENIVHDGDSYLFKILMVAGKKVITRKWGTEDLPTQTHWVDTVGEIHMMERLTHRLRLTGSQMDSKWRKWTLWQLTQN